MPFLKPEAVNNSKMKPDSRGRLVTILAALALLMATTCAERQTKHTGYEKLSRRLSENISFQTNDFYDPRTANMRTFLIEKQADSTKGDPDIKITTEVGPDGAFTTGNADEDLEFEKLLPQYDSPYKNRKSSVRTKSHLDSIQIFFDIFNLNLFSEDPNSFQGEYKNYFSIVNKRGLVFYYLSRIILYGAVIYMFTRYVWMSYTEKAQPYVEDPNLNRKYKVLAWLQSSAIGALLIVGICLFLISGEPRSKIINIASDLLYSFRKINHNVDTIIQQNKFINSLGLKVPPMDKERFTVQDRLSQAKEGVAADVSLAEDFANALRGDDQLTSYGTPIALLFISLVLSGLSALSIYTKSPNMQVVLFIGLSLTLSYLLFTIGLFFASYSGIFDVCKSMVSFETLDVWPSRGGGLAHFLGCSEQDAFFQQLYANMVAQHTALRMFNNEMFRAKLPAVPDISSASRVSTFLNRLDASNYKIRVISIVMEKNEVILKSLLEINNCNSVRAWTYKAEEDLCYTTSRRLMLIFAIYWIAVLCIILAIITTHFGQTIMNTLLIKDKVAKHTFNRDRFSNDFKLE